MDGELCDVHERELAEQSSTYYTMPEQLPDESSTWNRVKFWIGLGLGITIGAISMHWYWIETTCQAGEMCL